MQRPTCLSNMDLGPIKSMIRSVEGDLGTLCGKTLEERDICSATSWLATMTMEGTAGRLSRTKTGGLPNSSCISRKMISSELSVFY